MLRTSFKHLIYLALVFALTLTTSLLYTLPYPGWFITTAFLLAIITPQTVPPLARMVATFMASVALAMIVLVMGMSELPIALLAVLLVALTFGCVALSIHYNSYRYIFVLMVFYAIFAGGGMAVEFSASYLRGSIILLGGLLATLPQLIFLPNLKKNELSHWLILTMRNLSQLSEEIFDCFVRPEYADNVYLFERRLHLRKAAFLRSHKLLRVWMQRLAQNKNDHNAEMITEMQQRLLHIEFMFDLLMDCAQLRRRVSDHTVFALCQNELNGVAVALVQAFEELAQDGIYHESVTDTLPLQEKIELLENNFQTVLRVAAREPLAFLLFVASLKHLREEIGLYV